MRTGFRIFLISAAIAAIGWAAATPTVAAAQAEDVGHKKADYVGAETCQTCHPTLYDKYAKTAHTKKTQEALKENVVMPVKNKMTNIDDKVMFSLRYKADTRPDARGASRRLWITLYNLDGTNPTEYPVALTLGGGSEFAGKQRLIGEFDVNGDAVLNALGPDGQVTRLIFPVQFNHHDPLGAAAWAPYHPEHWYNADGTLIGSSAARYSMKVAESQFANSWERRCIGCHSTGTKITFSKKTGMFINDGSEFNVWCEACHGPGSKHVGSANPKDIQNPADWSAKRAQQAMDTCARCHIRGGNVGSGAFSTGYPAKVKRTRMIPFPYGGLLADWYTPGEGTWGATGAAWGKDATELEFSKKHHQQGFGFIQSNHWTNPFRQVFCWDCHDPHSKGAEGPQLRVSNDDNTLCLNCHADHGFEDEAAITEHTQHSYKPDTIGTSRCSKCHMPKTGKSATWYNDNAGDVHSHNFEAVPPTLTNKMAKKGKGTDEDGTAIPNGCNGCHDDADYGKGIWKRWKKAGGGQTKVAYKFE